MAQVANRQIAEATRTASGLLLTADVGGTYARVGLLDIGGGTPTVSEFKKYACADYPSLTAILADFLGASATARIERAAIACAGYVLDDIVINANLPWQVSLAEIRATLGLNELLLINDFTAIAYGAGYVAEHDAVCIAASTQPLPGPVLLVGPGTGLGAAVRIPDALSPQVLSTEAGQSALMPSTEIEMEILRRLLRDSTHVPIEHVLSGPGLANLYAVIGAMRGAGSQRLSPREVTDAAQRGDDAVALESLQVFCAWLGSVVGNLVLLYGAQGGVFLAGGILPQIKDFLLRSDFVERFRDKGPMRALLERVPVSLIEHGQLGVLGAAGCYLHRHRAI